MTLSSPPRPHAPTRRTTLSTPARSDARGDRTDRFGGTAGNEVLTRAVAIVLVLLLAAEGITVLSIEGLVQPHMFIGLVLIPPVLLKLASTGYRFARYYIGSRAYREKGPPILVLRMTAPVLVLATIALFTTGIWLMALGHGSDRVLTLHTVSFGVWGAAFAIHLLAHAPAVARSLRSDWRAMLRGALGGAGARAMLLVASLGGGVALALSMAGLITGWHGE